MKISVNEVVSQAKSDKTKAEQVIAQVSAVMEAFPDATVSRLYEPGVMGVFRFFSASAHDKATMFDPMPHPYGRHLYLNLPTRNGQVRVYSPRPVKASLGFTRFYDGDYDSLPAALRSTTQEAEDEERQTQAEQDARDKAAANEKR